MTLHEAIQQIIKEDICITREEYPKGTFIFGTKDIIIPIEVTSYIVSKSYVPIKIGVSFFECDKHGNIEQFVPREIDKTSDWIEYRIK